MYWRPGPFLGSIFEPTIELRSKAKAPFAVGASYPSPRAMMALGFAGLGVFGWRGSRKIATPTT
jgi:hypothetical protein